MCWIATHSMQTTRPPSVKCFIFGLDHENAMYEETITCKPKHQINHLVLIVGPAPCPDLLPWMLWDHCIVGKPPTSQLLTALQLPSQRMRALTGLCIYRERETWDVLCACTCYGPGLPKKQCSISSCGVHLNSLNHRSGQDRKVLSRFRFGQNLLQSDNSNSL